MAGTARMVPATTPFRSSCRTSPSILRSEQLAGLELAVVHAVEADLAIADVAALREVARSGCALVVDHLALGQELEPVDRAVHLLDVALRDLAEVVLDDRPGGV